MINVPCQGPNERRCIVREALDFYRMLVVGGIYECSSQPTDPTSVSSFAPAIKRCIDVHPCLSAVVSGAESSSPYFEFCPRLDLNRHVEIRNQPLENDQGESEAIERLLPDLLDTKQVQGIPPWKVVILPFTDRRFFLAFAYSHGLLDGMSGMAFHRTFLDAIQEGPGEKGHGGSEDLVYSPTFRPLPPPFDTKENLPISWSFLLSPLLSVYLPASFGFRANIITPTTWTGSSIFHDPDTFQTGLEMFSIDATTVEKVLHGCRANGGKMTGLLHELIAEAMFELLPEKYDNLAAQTAINMRSTVGIAADEMGLCAGGDTEILERSVGTRSWTIARSITTKLAAVSNRTQDQSLGLLRYLSDVRSWTLSKIGERRDCSYELSNLMSFRPIKTSSKASVKEMVFAQPASATGPTLCFNVVSVAGGPMVVAATWQLGALCIESKASSETDFVKDVCRRMQGGLGRIAEDVRMCMTEASSGGDAGRAPPCLN